MITRIKCPKCRRGKVIRKRRNKQIIVFCQWCGYELPEYMKIKLGLIE